MAVRRRRWSGWREREADVWFQLAVASPFYAGAHERFLRAELLCEVGRQRDAIGWYRGIGEFSVRVAVPGPARLRLAAITRNWASARAPRDATMSSSGCGMSPIRNSGP